MHDQFWFRFFTQTGFGVNEIEKPSINVWQGAYTHWSHMGKRECLIKKHELNRAVESHIEY